MSKPTKIIKTLCTLLVLLAPLLSLTQVKAQDIQKKYFGIIMTPSSQFINVAPGSIFSGTITLTNDFQENDPLNSNYSGESVATYYPTKSLFTQGDESGTPKFFSDSNLLTNADASTWITYSESAYEIDYGETVTSNFKITVPGDAEPGGHYAALVFQENPVDPAEAGGPNVELSKAIASLLFITVSGDLNKDGELIDFKASKNIYDFTPLDFSLTYQNNGNVHDAVGGNIIIYKSDITKPIAVISVNSEGKITLPNSTRTYELSFSEGFITHGADGYKIHPDKFFKIYFGKYTVALKLKHDEGNQRVTTDAEVTIWIIPWQIIIVAALLVITLLFIIFKLFVKKPKTKVIYVRRPSY